MGVPQPAAILSLAGVGSGKRDHGIAERSCDPPSSRPSATNGTWRAQPCPVLRRLFLPFLVAFVLVSAVSAVADALVVTELERLGTLANLLTEEDSGRRVDALLRHVAPEREPVEITVAGRHREFAEGQEVDAAETLRVALTFAEQRDVVQVQRTVNQDRDNAVVALRLRASGEVHNVTLHLRHHDDRWLAHRIVVR